MYIGQEKLWGHSYPFELVLALAPPPPHIRSFMRVFGTISLYILSFSQVLSSSWEEVQVSLNHGETDWSVWFQNDQLPEESDSHTRANEMALECLIHSPRPWLSSSCNSLWPAVSFWMIQITQGLSDESGKLAESCRGWHFTSKPVGSRQLPCCVFHQHFLISIIISHDMESFIIAPPVLAWGQHLKGHGLPSTVIPPPFKEEVWRISSCLEDTLGFSKALCFLSLDMVCHSPNVLNK